MRINLSCPFEEKEEAKALGAKWDGKTWYVIDPDDLMPFVRWMPGVKATFAGYSKPVDKARKASERQTAIDQRIAKRRRIKAAKPSKAKVNRAAPVITKSAPAYDCGCDHVLPWEDCKHTEQKAQSAMREMIA